MTWSSIVGLAKWYLRLGIVYTVIAGAAFAAGYFILYKRVFKGKKRLRFGTAVTWAAFACYLVVVCGVTLDGRGQFWKGAELVPFSSYRSAWYSFSIVEWRNLILNILMFVPFGFLLPCMFRKCQKPWITFAAGAGFTLLIEAVQLVFRLGIFEVDDILNNFLGAVIGYGIYRFLRFLVGLCRKEREKFLPILLFQAPLCLTAAAFCMIFFTYSRQELGNLQSSLQERLSVKHAEVRLEAALSQERKEAPIYRCHIADREETLKLAEEIFAKLGTEVDMSSCDYYSETAIYYSTGRKYCLSIDYVGCTVSYIDFDAGRNDEERVPDKEDADSGEVQEALALLGVKLPEGLIFRNWGEGRYLLAAERLSEGDVMYDGTLTCTYNVNGKIVVMDNGIIACETYRKAQVKSEQEAYEEFMAGHARSVWLDKKPKPAEIVIRSVTLGYERDSKGYYQPVYLFDVLCDQGEAEVMVPALD